MPVHPLTIASSEDGAFAAFPDHEIDGAGGAWRHGDDDGLAALATDPQRVMAAFEANIRDVGTEGFRDPESVSMREDMPARGLARQTAMLGRGRRRARCGPNP